MIPTAAIDYLYAGQGKAVVDALVELILKKAKTAENPAEVQALAALVSSLNQFCRG